MMQFPLVGRAVAGCAAIHVAVALFAVPFAQSASASRSASASKATVIGKSECAANKAAGKLTYVSPFGFDATIGIIDVFSAQKLGFFKDMCLSVQFVTNSEIEAYNVVVLEHPEHLPILYKEFAKDRMGEQPPGEPG